MSRIHLTVRSDGLLVEAIADAGQPCTRDELVRAITAAGITDGLDDAAITRFANDLLGTTPLPATIVARGRAPEPGTDGDVQRAFATQPSVGRQFPDGHIDWHERDLLHPAATGDLVASIVAPSPGVPGVDVRGHELTAKPGRPHTVRFGPGVQLDGARVLAAKNGVVLQNARTVDVVDRFEHSGDVDLKSGNLHTKGTLGVQGDVREQCLVEAGGDVVIRGAVQGATVVSGGSVFVGAGVLHGSVVTADGNITARHATSSRLEAVLDVQLGDEATHSFLRGENIRIVKGHGAAFGGELRARTSIALVAAGTANGAPTLLAVADVVDEHAEVVRATNQDTKVNRNFGRPARDLNGPSGKSARTAMKSDDRARTERLRVVQRQRALLQGASITITGTLHAGVRIRFGDASLVVDTPRTHVRFRWDAANDRIVEENLP